MAVVFSFIKHPVIGLLEKAGLLIPGVEKAVALFYDHSQLKMQSKILTTHANSQQLSDLYIEDINAAQKLRTRKIQYQWMASENLPFETKLQGRKQLNIFDELNNIVLCLGFKNDTDKNTDLLFLYLNHNKGNFGISNSNQNLSTGEKSIIGTMAYNSLNMYLQQQLTDSNTLKLVNQKVNLLQNENETLNKKLIQLTENYLASILVMCNNHLQNLSDEYGVTFKFAPDAVDKLQYFNGNIDELKEKLTQSALLALNLNFGQSENQIVLKAWDIDFTGYEIPKQDKQIIDINERYQKTFQLLNKLENAARFVSNKNQRITSENVGQACPTPISAPAISDALKNHQRKLIKLMTEHPDKWPILRNEFRPVKNILQNIQAG